MPELVAPHVRFHASWRDAVTEFGDEHMDGSGHHGPVETTYDAFAAMVADRLAQEDPATPIAPDRVHCTFRWLVEGEEFLGYLAVRHSLNDFLLDQGGHVGYAVRPSRRRQGHATRMLAGALPIAAGLGIDRVLVTCDDDNEASRRTIVAGGGVLEDVRSGKERYWIDVPQSPAR